MGGPVIGQRRRVRRLYALLLVAMLIEAGAGIVWGRQHGAREYARGAADVVLYASWVADSAWAWHVRQTIPHTARLPNGEGDTVTVVFYVRELPRTPKGVRLP